MPTETVLLVNDCHLSAGIAALQLPSNGEADDPCTDH
jgi:hypothetical protein